MNRFYTLVADRAGHRCEYCHAPELVFNFAFEIEHIIPIYLGGNDTESNLALACRSCNLRKGICTTGIDPKSKIEIPPNTSDSKTNLGLPEFISVKL